MAKREKLLARLSFHKRQVEKIERQLENFGAENSTARRRYVYALLCENNYYYIGQTTSPERRFKQHVNGKGSWFTKLHKPVKIIEVVDVGCISIPECMSHENALAAQYIYKHGINFVRGGDFIQREAKYFINQLNSYAPVSIEKS